VPDHRCAFERASFAARKHLGSRIDALDLQGRPDRVSRILDELEREILPGTQV